MHVRLCGRLAAWVLVFAAAAAAQPNPCVQHALGQARRALEVNLEESPRGRQKFSGRITVRLSIVNGSVGEYRILAPPSLPEGYIRRIANSLATWDFAKCDMVQPVETTIEIAVGGQSTPVEKKLRRERKRGVIIVSLAFGCVVCFLLGSIFLVRTG